MNSLRDKRVALFSLTLIYSFKLTERGKNVEHHTYRVFKRKTKQYSFVSEFCNRTNSISGPLITLRIRVWNFGLCLTKSVGPSDPPPTLQLRGKAETKTMKLSFLILWEFTAIAVGFRGSCESIVKQGGKLGKKKTVWSFTFSDGMRRLGIKRANMRLYEFLQFLLEKGTKSSARDGGGLVAAACTPSCPASGKARYLEGQRLRAPKQHNRPKCDGWLVECCPTPQGKLVRAKKAFAGPQTTFGGARWHGHALKTQQATNLPVDDSKVKSGAEMTCLG